MDSKFKYAVVLLALGVASLSGFCARAGQLSVEADPGRGHHRGEWGPGPGRANRRRSTLGVDAPADHHRQPAGGKRQRRGRAVCQSSTGRPLEIYACSSRAEINRKNDNIVAVSDLVGSVLIVVETTRRLLDYGTLEAVQMKTARGQTIDVSNPQLKTIGSSRMRAFSHRFADQGNNPSVHADVNCVLE
jgi:hypothetical protein